MSRSFDGRICFGVKFSEDEPLPWERDGDGCIEEWWTYTVCGYKNPFELYDENGEWIDGKRPTDQQLYDYFDAQREFETMHPLPVYLVNCGSGNDPMLMLAIGKFLEAGCGNPVVFEPSSLVVSDEDKKTLLEFCVKYNVPVDGAPRWWLSSYTDY